VLIKAKAVNRTSATIEHQELITACLSTMWRHCCCSQQGMSASRWWHGISFACSK